MDIVTQNNIVDVIKSQVELLDKVTETIISSYSIKNITKKGLEYGENRNDKHNLNETHPEWYVDKFGELLERLGVSQGNMFE